MIPIPMIKKMLLAELRKDPAFKAEFRKELLEE
jgi:hypothetical protein